MAREPSPTKRKFDAFQRSHPAVGFVMGVVRKASDDRGSNLAALLTYYGFFSLFPLMLVAFTILGFTLDGNPKLQTSIGETLRENFPLPGIEPTSIKGSGLALVIGILLTLWSGLAATQAAQEALNTIWDVPRGEQPSFVLRRLKGLALISIVGVGLVAATAASSITAFLGPAAGIAGLAAGVLLNAAILATLFRVSVERKLSWAEVRWGALFGGVAWTALQGIGSWYTRRLVDNADKTYGTFAVVIGLLSWIYLQSQVFVYAAEISSVSSRKLWPRSLVADDLTEADHRVAEALAERSKPKI